MINLTLWAALACSQQANRSSPPITAVAFAPDNSVVVLGSQAGLEVRSWPELQSIRRLETQLVHVHDLAFSPQGDVLAVSGGKPAEGGTIEFLRWPGGDLLRRDSSHRDVIYAVAWSRDGGYYATASGDQTCRVHEAPGGQLVCTFEGHSRPVRAITFLPDGAVISASMDQTIHVWDSRTGQTLRVLDNHVGAVHGLALHSRQAENQRLLLASASADKTVRLWQPATGRLVRFARLPCEPLTIAWSADGQRLLAGCVDGKLRIIDPENVAIVHELPVLTGWCHTLAVPPAGHVALVAGSGGELRRVTLPTPGRKD